MVKTRQNRGGSQQLATHIYEVLAARPGQTPESLADSVGKQPAEIGVVLQDLERAGYVRRQPNNQLAWQASDIQTAQLVRINRLRDMLTAIGEQLDVSEILALSILKTPHQLHNLDNYGGVSYIPDSASAYALAGQLGVQAAESIDSILTSVPTEKSLEISIGEDWMSWERGVRSRSVFPHAAVGLEYIYDYAEQVHDGGGEVRIATETPVRMVIFDKQKAIIGATALNVDSPRLFVESFPLVQALSHYFELLWNQSEGSLDETTWTLNQKQREVLLKLMNGDNEATIARKMDISSSTVHRIIDHLQKRTGVQGRFALGVYAERRGWIPKSPLG